MNTNKIRGMIKEAVAIEKSNRYLFDATDMLARQRGINVTPQQINEVVLTVQEYINHIPALIDETIKEAKKSGIYNQIQHVLKAVEDYFLAPVDVIPDHLGLLGLLDDAYLGHSLMQSLSDSYKMQTGKALLSADMKGMNTFMRGLIGEPHASMLDAGVANVLNGPTIQQSMTALLNAGSNFNMSGPDPVWGNASMDEIVNARLGAMGVV